MLEFIEVTDRFGRKRRIRKGEPLKDGERAHVPLQFMDAATREMVNALGGPPTLNVGDEKMTDPFLGHRRGFQSAPSAVQDAVQRNRDEAANAYEERNQRLQNAWRMNKD